MLCQQSSKAHGPLVILNKQLNLQMLYSCKSVPCKAHTISDRLGAFSCILSDYLLWKIAYISGSVFVALSFMEDWEVTTDTCITTNVLLGIDYFCNAIDFRLFRTQVTGFLPFVWFLLLICKNLLFLHCNQAFSIVG